VNAYGAFGAVTRERHEIILDGTTDEQPTDRTVWKVIEFKGKPGDPKRRPPQVAPYLRLDWLMWFIPLSIMRNGRIATRSVDLWFLRLIAKLLVGDRAFTSLLRHNPFRDAPPRFVRAHVYRYRYTERAERKATGAWWKASFVGELVPPIGLAGVPFDDRAESAPDAVNAEPRSFSGDPS
jgi:Lipase maturation factor